MNRKIAEHSVNSSGLFVLTRDQAFFKALFFSGDSGSDLGMVRTEEILRFPQDDGLLFNHVWGKTLRDGVSNVFGIRRHLNPELCPAKAIETYVAVATELRVSVTNGYLFRPTKPSRSYCEQTIYKLISRSAFEAVFERSSDRRGRNTTQLPFGLSHNISFIWFPVGRHNVSCGMEQQRHGSLLHETGGGASFRQSLSFVIRRLLATSALTEN